MDLVKMSNLKPGELLIGDTIYRNIMYFPNDVPYTAIDVACSGLIAVLYSYESRLNAHQVNSTDMLIYRVKREFCDIYRKNNENSGNIKVIVMNSGKDDIFNTCFSEKQSALTKIWDIIYPAFFIDEFFASIFHHIFISPIERHYSNNIIDTYASTVDLMQMCYTDPIIDAFAECHDDTEGFNTAIAEARGFISLHLKNIMAMEEYFKKVIKSKILDPSPEDPNMPFILHKEDLLRNINMSWFNWISYYESCVKGCKLHYYNGVLYETFDGTWKWHPLYEPITKRVMGKTILSRVCTIADINTTAPNSGILFFNRNIDEITFDTYEHAIDFLKI